jgi:carboxyl-terminal processing protease
MPSLLFSGIMPAAYRTCPALRRKDVQLFKRDTVVGSLRGVVILALVALLLPAACVGAGLCRPSPNPPLPAITPTVLSTPAATPLATATVSSPIPTATAPPTITDEATARQLRVFTQVWEAVRDTYVYPDFNGLDWEDVYRRYRVRIESGLTDQAFYQAMWKMIDELGDDHSAFYSPEEVAEEEAELSGQFDYVGVGIYVVTLLEKRYAVLLQVFPGSPAERAGLQSHDRLLSVDGIPVVDVDGVDQLDRLLGPAGSPVRLTVQTPGQEPRELVVRRERIEGQLQVEAYRLPETEVGYLSIPTFWDETIAARVREALEGLMARGDLSGLIVDVRINGGGLLAALEDTLAIFASGQMGVFVSRDAERPLVVEADPVGNSQELPLVILAGRETESFGEVFSGVLQEKGRARVVGRTTDGNVETLWQVDLEDGSRAWIASETFRPPSGADWEISGIIPDLEIPLDWDEFTTENDPQLGAALELLLDVR